MPSYDFDEEIEKFLDYLGRGVPRKDAAQVSRVPYTVIEARLAEGRDAVEDGHYGSDEAQFLADVLQREAAFRIDWFREQVVDKADAHGDPNKAYEILARLSPDRYASPGTRKVLDPDSGGEGPAASMLRSIALAEEDYNGEV